MLRTAHCAWQLLQGSLTRVCSNQATISAVPISNCLLDLLSNNTSRTWRRSFTSPPGPSPQAASIPQEACAASYVAGQPTTSTHPWLLGPGELTPGITAAEYAARRERLCAMLPAGTVVVLPSASTTYMAGVIPYPYRQDPDTWYLTGVHQHCVVVLVSTAESGATRACRFILFIEPHDQERVRWDGARLDGEAGRSVFGADEVYYTHEIKTQLQRLCAAAPLVLFDTDRVGGHAYAVARAAIPILGGATPRISPLRPIMHTMRLQKSAAEVALMRLSAHVSAAALQRCIETTAPGTPEYALAATFEYQCKVRGASRMSYPQVVASGSDACTIHYGRNDKRMAAGDVVLMDAGCELHGYCSDVTRTWPVSARFSGAQRDVYDVVLAAHQACVKACAPGTSIRELHARSVRLLSEGIQSLGLCKGASLDAIEGTLYRTFFWHSLGHWLGLDTHDTALMGHDRPLKPGHCITIEPGLYIPDEPQYGALRGIGVRIEDDVAVTERGCEVLSAGVPVAREEIEAMVGARAQRR